MDNLIRLTIATFILLSGCVTAKSLTERAEACSGVVRDVILEACTDVCAEDKGIPAGMVFLLREPSVCLCTEGSQHTGPRNPIQSLSL